MGVLSSEVVKVNTISAAKSGAFLYLW